MRVMFDTRRLFIARAFLTTGGLVAATCLPRESFGGCASETRSYRFSDTDNPVVHIQDGKLGDGALKEASLTITPGGDSVIFRAQVCTHFTHTKDVWNMHLQIFQGSQTLLDQSIKGPQMSEQDKPLFHVWHAKIPLHGAA